MPRHRIPGDRLVKNDAGSAQVDRRAIEMSGDGFDITTPDASGHDIEVTAGGLTLVPPEQPGDPYEGQSTILSKAISIPSAGTGFFDYSGASTTNEGPGITLDGTEADLTTSTFVFEESGLYSVSWYVEKNAEPAVDIWFQLLASHSNVAFGNNNDNWFTLDKMRGGASPYWAGRANVTDWFIGTNEHATQFSAFYLKYTSSGLSYPYAMNNTQLTIAKIL